MKNNSRKTIKNVDKNSEKSSRNSGKKFVIVGIGNTFLDFGLMNVFSLLGLGFFANYLSTFIAMISSFYFNKKWTFNSHGKSRKALRREIILFFVFTIIGIWLIQSPLMWLLEFPLHHVFANFHPLFSANFYTENFAKVFASVVSLTWNFFTYKRFVFGESDKKSADESTEISAL